MFRLPLEPRYILNQFISSENNKTDKIPLHPHTLKAHNAQDPSIWLDEQSAKTLLAKQGDGYSLGFVFVPDDKYFFVDIDNCLLDSGVWSPLAIELCTLFSGCYIEVSNSGRGMHIIGRYEGDTPVHNCKNPDLGVEFYTSGRFCALSQANATGYSSTVKTQSIPQFLAKCGLEKIQGDISTEWTTQSCTDCNPPDDNQEILNIIARLPQSAQAVFKEKGHAEFNDLFEKNEAELAKFYPSYSGDTFDRSAADSALAYRLHYFLGGNCERVQQIMELSQLKRDKWNRSDYLPRTIIGAKGKQSKFFVYHGHNQANATTAQSQQNLRILQKTHYPELNETFMKPIDTATNLKFLLDKLGIRVRYNEMSRSREITFPDYIPYKEDEENLALYRIKDIAAKNYFPITRIDEHLDAIAEENPFHPVVEGLQQNPWDGVPRLTKFIQTLKTSNDELSYKLTFRWMLSAIAAAHSKTGFSAQGVLVLAGEQYIGKTRFFKSLDCFNCRAVKEGAILDPTNKDNLMTLASHWIIELGELDGTFRRADIARLKSHLTSDVDVLRKPFGRKDTRFARRTVYAASVNDSRFLVDNTGNRRWWTLPVVSIDLNHGLDMTQVWAETYSVWKTGVQTWLTDEEFHALNDINRKHEQLEPFEEKLHHFYDFSDGWEQRPTEKKSATIILNTLGYLNVSRSDATRMAAILKKATGREPNRRLHTVPVFKVPENK